MRHAVVFAVLIAGCSDSGPRFSSGRARIVNGPTAGAAAPRVFASSPSVAFATTQPPRYWVSPDKVKATLTGVTFFVVGDTTGGKSAELSGCEVTYDRTAPTLATLLDCPFRVPVGTYQEVRLEFSRTFQVLVSDPVNGIFTDPRSATKFSATQPTGGAQFVDMVTDACPPPPAAPIPGCNSPTGNISGLFAQPFVVADSGAVQLTVVMHGLHTFVLQKDSTGVLTNLFPNKLPVFLVPSVTNVGKADYYSSGPTAQTFLQPLGSNTQPEAVISFVVFEDAQGPTMLWWIARLVSLVHPMFPCFFTATGNPVWNGLLNTSPSVSRVGKSGNRPGGYLGRDASGTLGWADPADGTYTTYVALFSMKEATAPGASTTLKCLTTTNPPPPVSGNTYSSGVPAIASPTGTIGVALVAH